MSFTYDLYHFKTWYISAYIEIPHKQTAWMCRLMVSLSYSQVLISSPYATKRYRKLKVFVFHRTCISWSLVNGIGFDLYDNDLVKKLFNTGDFCANFELEKGSTCTYMYVINYTFHFDPCILNYDNYMYVMHMLHNIRFSPFQCEWEKGHLG